MRVTYPAIIPYAQFKIAEADLRGVVVNDLPSCPSCPNDECTPSGRIASTCSRPLQFVLPAGQHQAGSQRADIDLRERQRSHRLTSRVAPSISLQDRACPTTNNLASDKGGLGRVLIFRHKRNQV